MGREKKAVENIHTYSFTYLLPYDKRERKSFRFILDLCGV